MLASPPQDLVLFHYMSPQQLPLALKEFLTFLLCFLIFPFKNILLQPSSFYL